MDINSADAYISQSIVSDKWKTLTPDKQEQYLFTAKSVVDSIARDTHVNYERAIYEQIIYMLMHGLNLLDLSAQSLEGASRTFRGSSYISPVVQRMLHKRSSKLL